MNRLFVTILTIAAVTVSASFGVVLAVDGGFTAIQIVGGAAPAASPADRATIYYDTTSDTLKTSLNGAAFADISTGVSTGALLRAPQVITSGTSYTTPAGCTLIVATTVGGGGGSAGTTGSTGLSMSSGGGAGATAIKSFTVTASTAYTIAIGAGGVAGASAGGAGGTGGSTTITVGGTTVTAAGGLSGLTVGNDTTLLIQGGRVGGTATNGDINIKGAPGAAAIRLSGSSAVGGSGGSSPYGGGGADCASFGAACTAVAGGGFGGGAGGGVSQNISAAGAAGAAGVLIVYEYKM